MTEQLRWLLVASFLVGCTASGPLGPAPVAQDGNAARVVFVRPWHFQGGGATIPIMIDGVELYGLDNGQHVEFMVPAGEHLVGMKAWDPTALVPTRIYPTVTLNAEPGRTY